MIMIRMFARYLIFLVLIGHTVLAQVKKVRLGVAGMTHGHVGWIYGKMDHDRYEFVGFAEPDKALAAKLFSQHDLPSGLYFPSLEKMIEEVELDGVVAFGSIYEHREVVRECAPKGIHVMVEKPLAVNMEHASEMAELAKENNILLLTNYETSWWSSTHKIIQEARNGKLGTVGKIVVHDGHQGPVKINVSPEFLKWLTDPVLNGGGAVIDFGCYGANISTAIMKNQKPLSVTGILQQFQPDLYPRVDDEATIILTYSQTQAVIQASWNWPYNRKDIEVYGSDLTLFQQDPNTVMQRQGNEISEISLEQSASPLNDPFLYFSEAILGNLEIKPMDVYSLENNLIVVEILEAAIQSSKTGKTVYLEE